MKKAMLWHKEDGRIRCDLCGRRCLIPEGQTGFCLVRKNKDGKLFSLNYGKLIATGVDPIEKKPLFHFLPGSYAFSIAAAGCNFTCSYCCNWHISQVYRDEKTQEIIGENFSPQDVIDSALRSGCKSISYTYTEPTTFFEFAYDTSRLAHKFGLKNTFVTNGYMTPEAVREIASYLDAATVDFKGNADPKFYLTYAGVPKIEPIFECLKEMKRQKIFIEITNLVIPRFGEDEESFRKLVRWVVDELGDETPFHILRFFPTYKVRDWDPTSVKLLDKFWEIAKEGGLKYVYLGNVPGYKENTYCPSCGNLVIERFGLSAQRINLRDGRCPKCGETINVVVS